MPGICQEASILVGFIGNIEQIVEHYHGLSALVLEPLLYLG